MKLLRTLRLNCGRRNYCSNKCRTNSETYTCVVSLLTLVNLLPSSYEELEGYRSEEVDLRSAADLMTKIFILNSEFLREKWPVSENPGN